MSIVIDCTINTLMETQESRAQADSTVKLPLCHEMRDLVDELRTPWAIMDTPSSSSDSLSPRAPLADISLELQDFDIPEKDDLFQRAFKRVEIDEHFKKAVELETEECKEEIKNDNLEKVVTSHDLEMEKNKWKTENENTEKNFVSTELQEKEYLWSVEKNKSVTGVVICRLEREEYEGKLENNSEKIMTTSKAKEGENQELGEVCPLDQTMAVLRVGRENCEKGMQKDDKEMVVTFSEMQKKRFEIAIEGRNLDNFELSSGVSTEGPLCSVSEEDKVGDREYAASVSGTGSPQRRTIAAGDGGADPLCVGTHGFFHMQPETEQVVWGPRRASDRDPSISAPSTYHTADISAGQSCASVEQAIIPSDINAVLKYTDVDCRNVNINLVSLNNANVKQHCVTPNMNEAQINTKVADENEQIDCVHTGTVRSDDQLYRKPTLGVATLETNTSNECQNISGASELIRGSTIAVELNVRSEQRKVSVGDVRLEMHIAVGDRTVSPIEESSNTEAVCVTAPLEGIRNEEAFSDAKYTRASVTDAADVTRHLSRTENVHSGGGIASVDNNTLVRNRSAEKYVQTDYVSPPYSGLVSDGTSALKTVPVVSIDKLVQTDYLRVLSHEQTPNVSKTESSVSLLNVNSTGTLDVHEDCDPTNVYSVLPSSENNDFVGVLEDTQSVNGNEYPDEGKEITGISGSFVSGEPESNSTISVSDSNQPSQVLGQFVSVDEMIVTQTDAVSDSSETSDGTGHCLGGRMNSTESKNVEGEGFGRARAGEESRLLTEGLSCTLQLLTYRDRLLPPLCPSCLLPQSATSIRQGGTRVHNSAQITGDIIGDHVTFLGHSEDSLLKIRDVLEPEDSVDRLSCVTDEVQRPINHSVEDYLQSVKHDIVSGSHSVTSVQGCIGRGHITSLLYQPQHGDYSVKNESDVTRETDVSSGKPADSTSSDDNVRMPHRCQHGDKMGSHYSTQGSEKCGADQCQTGSEEGEPNTDGQNAVLKVTNDDAVLIITNTTNVDLKNVSSSVNSDCVAINTDSDLINVERNNVEVSLSSDGVKITTEGTNTDHTDVVLNTDTINGDLKCCQLNSANEAVTVIEEANSDQRDVALSVTCDTENTDKTSTVDIRDVGLSSTADGATTCIVPTTIEQLTGATRNNNRSNISFPFIDDKDNAANEGTAVAMETRDNIRLDIDRCVASFQRDHVVDTFRALGGRGISCEATPEENDLSKREDMGHEGVVAVNHSDKETQTPVDIPTVIASEAAVRSTVDKETQTKAVGKECNDITEEATPTKQTMCTEAPVGLEKVKSEMATKTNQGHEEERIRGAISESHPCAAPSVTASPVSTADERRTSSGDIGSEAARDGTICAAADSSEQDAPESGRAAGSRRPVPRDQAPVHRASDAAVPRDTVSSAGNRCCDAMRQKNKTNDNDAASADKSVIIANGGTSTEAASGAANDCNGHVNNHHHHHSTARSILKSVLKRTGNGGHHKKTPGSKAATVPAPPPPPQQQPPPPQNQTAPKKKHRVQFDESKNKFFDADYVILIREEEEEEEEEEDEEGEEEEMEDEEEICTCGASAEMGRLLPPIAGTVKAPPPAGCGRAIQNPGGAVQVLLRTPGTCPHVSNVIVNNDKPNIYTNIS